MPTVAVLMSTYNGEKYIREQLDSIFKQKGVNVVLYVRDDGSTDDTIKILEEYRENHPVVIVFDGENVGPGESFMRLVYQYADEPDIEFYAFADQDDIWLEDKLKVAIETIIARKDNKPVLYTSNQYIYTDGENKGDRHKDVQRIDLISHMTRNTIAGCTFVFNKKLAQLLARTDKPEQRIIKYRLHDSWMMLVAILCGEVVYDKTSHMLYRIHSENVVGVRKMSVKKRLDRLKRYYVKRDDANLRMITAQELLRLFPQISGEDKEVLQLYADYQKGLRNKRKLICNDAIRKNCLENPLVFAVKVLTNFI